MLNRLDGVLYITGEADSVGAAAEAVTAHLLQAGDAETVGMLPSNETLFRARFTGVQLDMPQRLSLLAKRFPGIEVGAIYEARADEPLFGACVYDRTGEVLLEAGGAGMAMSEAVAHRFRHFA